MKNSEILSENEHHELKIKKRARWFIVIIVISLFIYILKPFIITNLINKGDAFLGYGMFKDAIREYRKALIFDSNLSDTWNWLGFAYKQAGDFDNAIRIYKKAVQINPKNRIAFYDLGMIYYSRKHFENAEDCFFKASLIDPEYKVSSLEENFPYHRSSLNMLSHCYEELGEIDKAMDANTKILKYYPDNKVAKERAVKLQKLRKESD